MLNIMNENKYKKKYKGGTFNLGNEITIGLIVVAIGSIMGNYILRYLSKPK